MTLNKLKKLVDAAVEAGHGRKIVAVNKPSFTHPLESDGVAFIQVDSAELKLIPMVSDDGGIALDSRGMEKHSFWFVLDGGNDPGLLDDSQEQP